MGIFKRSRRSFKGSRQESYGSPAKVSTGNRVSDLRDAAEPAYTDHRLRGLDPRSIGSSQGRSDPYDISAARYSLQAGDPYEKAARNQEDMGHRFPLPYQSPSALAGMPSLSGRPVGDSAIYESLHNDHSVNPAASVSGQRQTQAGTFGTLQDTNGGPHWDARKRFGYGQMGSRGTGYDDRWDTKSGEERTAGRLEKATTFDQEIMPHRPYLHLRAGGAASLAEGQYDGNAIFTVVAGNFQHGGTQIRQFWVGGGTVACFDLRGWDSVKIKLEELLDGTFAEFAWTDRGLAGQHRSLMYPDTYTSSASVVPVPQGAYAIAIEDPRGGPTTLEWTGRRSGNALWTFTEEVDTPASRSGIYYGQKIEVKGPTFKMSTSGDITWFLRPI